MIWNDLECIILEMSHLEKYNICVISFMFGI